MANSAASAALVHPVAKRGRNVFPLDNNQTYSIKAGQITPVKTRHFIPGDYFNIDTKDTAVTFPMNTYAFLNARKETSFYSVYYSAIWSLFNQYMATRQDSKTSAFGVAPKLVEPRMSLYKMFTSIIPQFYLYCYYQYLIPKFYNLAIERGFINSNTVAGGVEQMISIMRHDFLNGGSPGDSPYTLNSYVQQPPHLGFKSHLRLFDASNTWIDTAVSPGINVSFTPYFLGVGSNQIDYVESDVHYYAQDIVGHFRVYSWLRKLDMLGFGNFYPVFKTAEISFSNYEVQATKTVEELAQRLLNELIDSCQYIHVRIRQAFVINDVEKMTNLYAICAYNSVFYHFFRNSYYDLKYFNHDYSLDFVSVPSYGSDTNTVVPTDFSPRFLDIEYHQWKKDLFTSVLPDSQFGAVSSVSINGNIFSSSLSIGDFRLNSNPSLDNSRPFIDNFGQSNFWSIPNAFDVIQLKRAELLQDYRQTLMRAGNKTSDIFKALYGGSPSSEHEDDVIPRFLETFGSSMNINPVVSTAQTGAEQNGNLGDIGARASFTGGSSNLKFNAGENFGVIICLTYVVPDAAYNSYMLDRHNLELTPEQHFIPQYENYGLEPIYSDELNSLQRGTQLRVLGFGPRYYHKKSEVDKVHGAFVSVPWNTLGLDPTTPLIYSVLYQDFFGEFNHWISARTDMQNRGVTTLADFYINPAVLDNVFVRAVSPDQADDQFLCFTQFVVKSTRAMTKVGLLNFV